VSQVQRPERVRMTAGFPEEATRRRDDPRPPAAAASGARARAPKKAKAGRGTILLFALSSFAGGAVVASLALFGIIT